MGCVRLPAGAGTALALWAGFRAEPHLIEGAIVPLGLCGLACALTAGLGSKRRRAPLVLASVVLLGGSAGAIRSAPIVPLTSAERAVLAGKVTGWEPTAGGVEVRLLAFRVGKRRLSPPRPVRILGERSWGETPRSRWLSVTGRVEGARGGTVPGTRGEVDLAATVLPERGSLPRWGPGGVPGLWRARAAILERLDQRFTGFPRRFGEAMLLGRGRALTPEERDRFRRTGTGHLVAVSGLNVALAAVLVGLLLGGAPARVRALGIVLAAWGYAAMAAWTPSAVRAAAMVSAAAIGGSLRRPRQGRAWLALALPWLLWAEPRLAGSLSFRLSVEAVAGILFAMELAGPRGGRGVLSGLITSLGAQWGTLPATLATFGAAAPFALLPNLVAVPLSGLFLPAIGLSLLAGAAGWGGDPFGEAARGIAALLDLALRAGARWLPFSTALPEPHPLAEPLALAIPLVWYSLSAETRRAPRPRIAALVVSLAFLATVVVPLPPPRGPWTAFLDVGQGDAAVLRLSDGTVWVIDVGDDRGPGDAVKNALSPFLRHMRIRRVDALVLSHRHRDHVGALASFLEEVPVIAVYDGGAGPPGGTAGVVDSLLLAHSRWPCLVAAGDTLHAAEGISLVVAGPPREDGAGFSPARNLNDASLVLRVEDGPFTVLFAGDAEGWGEAAALAGGARLQARILKVGHHGSTTSSGSAFLDAVRPAWGIVSVGEGNRFGHPSAEVLGRLAAGGIRIHRTDRDGSALFRSRGETLVHERFPPLAPDPEALPP